jgi:hypothetical protein
MAHTRIEQTANKKVPIIFLHYSYSLDPEVAVMAVLPIDRGHDSRR